MKKSLVFGFLILAACSHTGPTPESDWDGFLKQVESGDKAALDRAGELRSEVDPTQVTALQLAVAHALPRAPHYVLALLERGFKLSELCGVPYPAKSTAAEAYVEEATRALQALANTPMEVRAKACLKRIAPPPPPEAKPAG